MNRTRFLFCCLTLALLVPGARQAEAQSPSTSAVPATFLQGESKQIPADFFAELEQSRLRLKLEDFGLRDAREGLEQALVTLITPSGPPQRAPSDAQGNVVFDNVAEGPVGLVVTGPGLHASAAVYATEAAQEPLAPGEPAPAENAVAQSGRAPFSLPVMRIDPLEVLKSTSAYAPVNVLEDFTPTEYAGFNHYEAVPVVYYQVLPLADGTVAGRVFTIVDPDLNLDYTGTNVAIYQGGDYFRSAVTGPSGFFELPDMPPGVYGLIAAGPMGYAAFAFEVLAPGAAAPGDLPEPNVADNEGDETFRTAAFAANAAPGDGVGSMLYVPLLPPAMLAELRRILLDAYGGLLGPDFAGVPPLGPPGFPPGGGFGGGAGGGGLGGGGGIGSLLGLAGLAGLAGLGGDDDGFVPPGFASPAVPIILPPFPLP